MYFLFGVGHDFSDELSLLVSNMIRDSTKVPGVSQPVLCLTRSLKVQCRADPCRPNSGGQLRHSGGALFRVFL